MRNTYRLFFSVVAFLVLPKSLLSQSMTKAMQLISNIDDIFYVEDNIRTRSQLMVATANSNSWSLESKIENCYDKRLIGKSSSRMTADGATRLSITLSYLPDDDKRVIESYDVKFYFYKGNDLFHDSDKLLVSSISQFVGSYSCENTQKDVVVHLTAPASYPLEIPSKAQTDDSFRYKFYSYYVVINVKFKNGASAAVARKIQVFRPGVILLHGLSSSSDKDDCFYTMAENLQKSSRYIHNQILNGDYKSSNTSSFYYNTYVNPVVENMMVELSDQLYEQGIASTKYDMVGHSMGGILFRKYIQEIDNQHTNKLITLNTPHYGSPLGNAFKRFVPLMEKLTTQNHTKVIAAILSKIPVIKSTDPSKSALIDLAERSDEIYLLNSGLSSRLKGIPCYAVATHCVSGNSFPLLSQVRSAEIESVYMLSHLFRKKVTQNPWLSFFDYTVKSDWVVSCDSQIGGLTKNSSVFKGGFLEAFHCSSPEWNVTNERIFELLQDDPMSGTFSLDGFVPFSSSDNMRIRKVNENDEDIISDFEIPKSTSFIKMSVLQEVENDSCSHKVVIQRSDDIVSHVTFCVLSENALASDCDKDVMSFDLKDFEGDVTFYTIGRTDYNAFVADSVSVTLNASGEMPEIKKGDVNLDGSVDISDVVAIINSIAIGENKTGCSDVNKDGDTDISDIVAVINLIAIGSKESNKQQITN